MKRVLRDHIIATLPEGSAKQQVQALDAVLHPRKRRERDAESADATQNTDVNNDIGNSENNEIDRLLASIQLESLSKEEFFDLAHQLPPLLRLGYEDGPGAVLCSEPYELRRCAVTGHEDNTYGVCVVLKAAGESQYFTFVQPVTTHEFKAWADRTIPGVGVCGWGWGAELLDDRGDLRSDLRFPIRYGLARRRS
jgi:hypothetical protein